MFYASLNLLLPLFNVNLYRCDYVCMVLYIFGFILALVERLRVAAERRSPSRMDTRDYTFSSRDYNNVSSSEDVYRPLEKRQWSSDLLDSRDKMNSEPSEPEDVVQVKHIIRSTRNYDFKSCFTIILYYSVATKNYSHKFNSISTK